MFMQNPNIQSPPEWCHYQKIGIMEMSLYCQITEQLNRRVMTAQAAEKFTYQERSEE